MKFECFVVLLLRNNVAGLKGNREEPQVIRSLLKLFWTRYEPILFCLSFKKVMEEGV